MYQSRIRRRVGYVLSRAVVLRWWESCIWCRMAAGVLRILAGFQCRVYVPRHGYLCRPCRQGGRRVKSTARPVSKRTQIMAIKVIFFPNVREVQHNYGSHGFETFSKCTCNNDEFPSPLTKRINNAVGCTSSRDFSNVQKRPDGVVVLGSQNMIPSRVKGTRAQKALAPR